MPHKHKRGNLASTSSYNLPPSQVAYPLNPTEKSTSQPKSLKRKTKDDTPRAFSRLFGTYRPPRSGLDDGVRPSKKKKANGAEVSASGTQTSVPTPQPNPTIEAPSRQYNESMSSFAARVDAALPLSGIQKKSGIAQGVDQARQTRTERKMQKMYKQWRAEDLQLKEKAEDMLGETQNDDDEDLVKTMGVIAEPSSKGKTKRKRKGKGKGKGKPAAGDGVSGSSDDEDPWAKITAKRQEAEKGSGGGLVGLHDVVQAPPRFTKVLKGKMDFKVGQGGLKRQVELSEARQSVVEGYRQMMKHRRTDIGVN